MKLNAVRGSYILYVYVATVNDKKLAGLKFGESANNLVWWKKVW